jgi:hypothetical protein
VHDRLAFSAADVAKSGTYNELSTAVVTYLDAGTNVVRDFLSPAILHCRTPILLLKFFSDLLHNACSSDLN